MAPPTQRQAVAGRPASGVGRVTELRGTAGPWPCCPPGGGVPCPDGSCDPDGGGVVKPFSPSVHPRYVQDAGYPEGVVSAARAPGCRPRDYTHVQEGGHRQMQCSSCGATGEGQYCSQCGAQMDTESWVGHYWADAEPTPPPTGPGAAGPPPPG